MSEGDHCVDGGAHKGYVALQLAQRVGRNGKVLAFEPDPNALAALSENCERNASLEVEVLSFALGEKDGYARFYLSRQPGWSTRFPNDLARRTVTAEVTVEVRALDSLIRTGEVNIDPERLSFVKLDCEGSEPLALKGMAQLLTVSAPVLWVEINRGSLEAAGSSPEEMIGLLARLGFEVFLPKRRWLSRFGWRIDAWRPDSFQPSVNVMSVAAVKKGTRMRSFCCSGVRLLED